MLSITRALLALSMLSSISLENPTPATNSSSSGSDGTDTERLRLFSINLANLPRPAPLLENEPRSRLVVADAMVQRVPEQGEIPRPRRVDDESTAVLRPDLYDQAYQRCLQRNKVVNVFGEHHRVIMLDNVTHTIQ